MDQPVEARLKIHGRVQGVGYRETACKIALELKLTGTVRNCEDGTVEVYAQGMRAELDHLVARLKGPEIPGRVTEIEVIFVSIEQPFDNFLIIP